MKRIEAIAIVVALFVACALFGQAPEPKPSPLKIPPTLTVRTCKLASIAATTEGKKIKWRIPKEFGDFRTLDNGKELVFVCDTPGLYTVLCFTAIGDEPIIAECLVTVETPEPPKPPPAPPSKFKDEFSALIRADSSPGKAESVRKLAQMYGAAATMAGDATKGTWATVGEMMSDIATAAAAYVLVPDALKEARVRVRVELEKRLGLDGELDQPLTPERRAAAVAVYSEAKAILEEMGK